MGKPNSIDFLSKPTPRHLRKQIRNICDSYSNPWDLLAELCQNALDAISLHRKRHGEDVKEHSISISIDANARSIAVRDTGVGFNLHGFADLMAPHGTDKSFEDPVIGQKGVGLTYAIFSSNYYEVDTSSVDGRIQGYVKHAAAWKNGAVDDMPQFLYTDREVVEILPEDTFTSVLVRDVERVYDETEEIFYQSIPVLEFLLRTRTAIGNLRGCFPGSPGLDIGVTLTVTNPAGEQVFTDLVPRYMLPSDFVGDKVVNLDEFKQKAAALDDRQKTRELQGRCLVKSGAEDRAGRRINYYCFFAPSRNLWDQICEMNQLTVTNSSGEEDNMYEGGIHVASRGMPTGITLDPPVTGVGGYWPNFYIVLEDDSIVFDLGRKSIPSRTKGMHRDIAAQLFREFRPFIEYVRTDPAVSRISTVQQYEKQKLFQSFQGLPDIGIDAIPYRKHPDGQEAGVVAVFHELVAAGILKGYYTLKRGYKMTYDLWGIYRVLRDAVGSNLASSIEEDIVEVPVVIEFKYKAEAILSDLEQNRKFFTDIDLLVCWDLDEAKFARHDVTVELLHADDRFFHGSNYRLVWPGGYNLGAASEKPVIALRKFIQDYLSEQ